MKKIAPQKIITLTFLSIIVVFLMNVRITATSNSMKLKKNIESTISEYYVEPIRVSVENNGVVTVEGEVNTLFDKLKIGELIETVNGVQKINNDITVINDITADDVIKSNIVDELQINDAILEPEKITVNVNKGVVTLAGTVSYYREKLIAQSIASWQDGVTELISNISVLPLSAAKSDENISAIVKDLIENRFPLEKNVRFSVVHGKVNLTGSVKNLWAKDHIQTEIQHILGVKEVNNNLTIERINEI